MAKETRNSEHYYDPTASDAIDTAGFQIQRQKDLEDMLHVFWDVAKLAGFNIQSRIVIKDLKTGKIYR